MAKGEREPGGHEVTGQHFLLAMLSWASCLTSFSVVVSTSLNDQTGQEMAQERWLSRQGFAARLDDLSLIPGTHVVDVET